jgi:hypothetical protein
VTPGSGLALADRGDRESVPDGDSPAPGGPGSAARALAAATWRPGPAAGPGLDSLSEIAAAAAGPELTVTRRPLAVPASPSHAAGSNWHGRRVGPCPSWRTTESAATRSRAQTLAGHGPGHSPKSRCPCRAARPPSAVSKIIWNL